MSAEHGLHREMQAASALRESLALYGDEDLLRDTIEGATELREMIAAVFASIADDNEMLVGIAARMEDLKQRKARFEKSIERKRSMIEQAMAIGEIKTLALPEATLSLTDKAQGIVIEKESLIPSSYWKKQPPKLDRGTLLKDLRAGTAVPGASLDNGGITLTIRRK